MSLIWKGSLNLKSIQIKYNNINYNTVVTAVLGQLRPRFKKIYFSQLFIINIEFLYKVKVSTQINTHKLIYVLTFTSLNNFIITIKEPEYYEY